MMPWSPIAVDVWRYNPLIAGRLLAGWIRRPWLTSCGWFLPGHGASTWLALSTLHGDFLCWTNPFHDYCLSFILKSEGQCWHFLMFECHLPFPSLFHHQLLWKQSLTRWNRPYAPPSVRECELCPVLCCASPCCCSRVDIIKIQSDHLSPAQHSPAQSITLPTKLLSLAHTGHSAHSVQTSYTELSHTPTPCLQNWVNNNKYLKI